MNWEPQRAKPLIVQYVDPEATAREALRLVWMHVQEYDFNDPRGHFSLLREQVDAPEGRWPNVRDPVMLVCTTPGDSFGCVVTVTKVEDSVRDGYLRYETDLGQRMALAREQSDEDGAA